MMRRDAVRVAACALGCLALAGCAATKQYMRAGLFGGLGPLQHGGKQYSDRDVLEAFSRQSQLTLPAKLAVYEATSQNHDYGVRDNETIEGIIDLLKDEEKFYQIVVLAPTFIGGPATPMNLRRAAAQHRADLTLLCESDFKVDVEGGLLWVFDLTILGGFFVPSRHIEVESRVTAHLIDTRNGLIYHSTLRKQSWQGRVPSFLGKDAVQRRRKELAERNYEAVAKDILANLRHAARLARQPAPSVVPASRPIPIQRPAATTPRPTGVPYHTAE